jgi:hypothetical protein
MIKSGSTVTWLEGEDASMLGRVVDDLHCPLLLHPQRTDDDVVNDAVHVRPNDVLN